MSTSLSRAFTSRRSKGAVNDAPPPMPKRSLTTKHSDTIRQQKISHPIELISTTNMLSYSAPDINRSRSSTNSSVGSMTSGSSASDASSPSIVTPATSPEYSSTESSPVSNKMPDLNNLSAYFPTSPTGEDVPRIPQRAPSHTKKSSEHLARKRSMSRVSAPKGSLSSRQLSSSTNSLHAPPNGRTSKSSLSTTRSSMNMLSPKSDAEHPFGNELAQVSELAEEYGSSKQHLPILDAEERELISLGLFKFGADDYMNELQEIFITAFGDLPQPPMALWI
jgi:hypothetical protein